VSTLVAPHFDEETIHENLKEFLTRWTNFYHEIAAMKLDYPKVPKGRHLITKTSEDMKFYKVLNEALVFDHEVMDFMK